MNSFSGSPGGSHPGHPEKRTVPRYMFIATAEIVDPVSGVRLSGRISEISLKGCFVDILNTLPVGTRIQLRISRDRGSFSTSGRIIYVQEGMGMGVAFLEISAEQVKILESWISELAS